MGTAAVPKAKRREVRSIVQIVLETHEVMKLKLMKGWFYFKRCVDRLKFIFTILHLREPELRHDDYPNMPLFKLLE